LTQPVTEFVGPLDAGGFFTLQAELMAEAAGEGEIVVRVEYQDDFNEKRELVERYTIAVEAAPEMPAMGEMDQNAASRGSGNILLRVIKGLLGLGASPPVPAPAMEIGAPMEGGPPPDFEPEP
jgi:hypothetical protein